MPVGFASVVNVIVICVDESVVKVGVPGMSANVYFDEVAEYSEVLSKISLALTL